MASTIYPVILSGGSGTRLWPLSRDLLPKQLLALVGDESLLAATARRVRGKGFAAPIIVCNKDHRFLVQEQLAAIGITAEAIVIEPVARNTAPAIAAAAAIVRERDPDGLILVLPSDHIILEVEAFHRAIGIAADAARSGRLVTFGITPTAPETGYGYISSGAALGEVEGAFDVARFVEKPDRATAETYLADGNWSWNSGMFVFPAGLLLDELAQFEPAIVSGALRAVALAAHEDEVLTLDAEAFGAIPSKSIDYALMEPTALSALVPASLGWSDVGSWSALWEIGDQDPAGNVAFGDVMTVDTTGSYIRTSGPLVATLGIEDIVIVATGDVVLAAAKSRAQDVKTFVSRLKERGRSEATSHRLIGRPWGSFQIVDSGPAHRVARIAIKPGARFSAQATLAENWVVANGTARITREGEILTVGATLSTTMPAGSVYDVENCGDDPVLLIAVRSGPGANLDDGLA